MTTDTAELSYEIIWDDEEKPEQVIDAPLERKLWGPDVRPSWMEAS